MPTNSESSTESTATSRLSYLNMFNLYKAKEAKEAREATEAKQAMKKRMTAVEYRKLFQIHQFKDENEGICSSSTVETQWDHKQSEA